MKKLTWKLVLPLTIISFATFTKWWYVFPVDAPDTMMSGFPLPFVCEGWHTSMSLQIFMAEFLIDLLVYFTFWFLLTYSIHRFLLRIKMYKIFTIGLLTLSILISTVAVLIASDSTNIFSLKRPWEMDVKTTGYKFGWHVQKRPDLNEYKPVKTEI